MKSILISIKPKWCAKIMNGEKNIVIRKNIPKCDLPIDVYIYCTKDTQNTLHKNCANIYWVADTNFKAKNKQLGLQTQPFLNGKVVAKFTLNKVEHFEYDTCSRDICGYWLDNGKVFKNQETCLSDEELWNYIKGEDGYAWHISDLEIFDKPKELSEFNALQRAKATDCGYLKQCKNCGKRFNRCHLLKPLTKAPQNYCYVEVE